MHKPAGEPEHPRPIRSYVLRQGRMSAAQTRALDTLGPQWMIPFAKDTPLNFAQVFGRAAPTIVEIGFGMGSATANIAAAQPEKNFLGLEVHGPGVGALLKMVGERNLTNVRVIQHDAVEVLTHMIADGSLAGVHIFFPDPWPKKRHHKRRLFQAEFVAHLATKVMPGGYVHLATDWHEYADEMLAVLLASDQWTNTATGFAKRPPYRTETNFERKGVAKGHGVWDIIFLRTESQPAH